MELNEYQNKAMTTCMDSSFNDMYMLNNLVGEVGELFSLIGKGIRKGNVEIVNNFLNIYSKDVDTIDEVVTDFRTNLKKELGDILWQLSGTCEVMGFSLEEVAQANLDKLQDRKKRNVIEGSGDNR